MMKRILLFFISISFLAALHAQNIEVYTVDDDQLVLAEQEFMVMLPNEETSVSKHFKVKNIGSASIDVRVRTEIITNGENASFSFCWKNCYPPGTLEGPYAVTIPANSFATKPNGDFETLDADLYTDGTIGTTKVALTVFDTNNENDQVKFYVTFDVKLSTPVTSKPIFKVYPNPTSDNIYIDGAIGYNVNVINAIGQVVSSVRVTDNNYFIDLSSQRTGIYFIQVTENGKTITTRKIIKQ